MRPVVWLTVFMIAKSASAGFGGGATGGATGLIEPSGGATALIEASALSSSGRAIGSFADAVAVFCSVAPEAEGATSAVIVTIAAPPATSVPS